MDWKQRVNQNGNAAATVAFLVKQDDDPDPETIADQILQDSLTANEYGEMYVDDSEAAIAWIIERFDLQKLCDERSS